MKATVQLAVGFALLAAGVPAIAAEVAILYNGNSILHERRQVLGAVTRLYLTASSDGYIEIPSDQIERFETDAGSSLLTAGGQGAQAPGLNSPPPGWMVPSREDLTQAISGASARHQIDPDFINSVIRAESGFHPFAVSKKGAQGLMQLMPQTASELGVGNAFDPKANVEGGTKYLRELLERYNFDVFKALAAYNAGPRRVDQYRGVPPYYETQAYIARIIRDFNRQKLAEHPELAAKPKYGSRQSSRAGNRAEHPAEDPAGRFRRSASETPQAASR